MDHDLRRNQGRFLEVDNETHSKKEPYIGVSGSLRFRKRSLCMKDIVHVWEHRDGPEVEVGDQRGQQLGENPGSCGQAER